MMDIRELDPRKDRAAVESLLTEAQDYYHLWKGRAPEDEEVDDFLAGGPPNFEVERSHRLGLYLDGRLSGLAELSFGFPEPGNAYLGLMILAPRARSSGNGQAFLAHVETLARAGKSPMLYLAVLEKNHRGRAFWERMGFQPTGITRDVVENGIPHRVYRLVKPF